MKNIFLFLLILFLTAQCGEVDLKEGFVVFLTSTTHDGDLNDSGGTGLAGGDNICNARAVAGGFRGTFRAWLSTATENAKDRIPDKKYYRVVDHALVANGIGDLTDGTIENEINIDDTGITDGGGTGIWTGTTVGGTVATRTCTNFTVAANPPPDDGTTRGQSGASTQRAAAWTANLTDGAAPGCATAQKLYCFQISN